MLYDLKNMGQVQNITLLLKNKIVVKKFTTKIKFVLIMKKLKFWVFLPSNTLKFFAI